MQAAQLTYADAGVSIDAGHDVVSRIAPMAEATSRPGVMGDIGGFGALFDLTDLVGEFSPETRFAVTWFAQHGYSTGAYGRAETLAQARGIPVRDVHQAGLIESLGGKVRLLNPGELTVGWAPDETSTVWLCCQHLIRAHDTGGEQAAADMLRQMGQERAGKVKDLAYCLYDICDTKLRSAAESRPYNDLISAWPELTRLAAQHRPDAADRQGAMEI